MWAQLVKGRIKDGTMEQLQELNRQWEEQIGRGTDSGWLRSFYLRNANDRNEVFELAYFESEEKARINEQNPLHLAILQQMLPLFEGELEFVDLDPIDESNR